MSLWVTSDKMGYSTPTPVILAIDYEYMGKQVEELKSKKTHKDLDIWKLSILLVKDYLLKLVFSIFCYQNIMFATHNHLNDL